MERLSEFLKKAREARGLSIEDISRITRINLPMLRALEGNHLEMLPAQVIARGFIRSYCKVVGISDCKALELYDEEVKPPDADLVDRLQIGNSDRSMKWIFIGAIMVVVILGILLFVYSSRNKNPGGKRFSSSSVLQKKAISDAQLTEPLTSTPRGSHGSPSSAKVQIPAALIPQKNLTETQEGGNSTSDPHSSNISGAPDPNTNPGPERPALIRSSSSLEAVQKPPENEVMKGNKPEQVLVIEAKELTWLQREIDYGPPQDITLHPGDKIVMRARNRISLYIGNAGGVKLTFNGKSINNLGPSDKVVYIVLPSEKWRPRN